MITTVRDFEGGYSVTLSNTEGEAGVRTTPSLAEAFAWQAYASVNGELPPIVSEAAVEPVADAVAEPVVEEGSTE